MKKHLLFFILILSILITTYSYTQDLPRTLYVLNGLGLTVSKMNLETNKITHNIASVGDMPNKIYTKNDKIYIVNSIPPGISIIDAYNDEVSNISLKNGSNPFDMAFAGTNKAYVTNLLHNSISVVNLMEKTILKDIVVGSNPEGILIVDNTAYIANTGGYPGYETSSVSIINIETDIVTKTLDVAKNPQSIAAGPDGKIYVLCTGNYFDEYGKICVIDPFGASDWTAAVVDTVEIGGAPGDIEITNTGIAYMADFGVDPDGYIYAYNIFSKEIIHNSTNPLLVGYGAMNLLWHSYTSELWINNFKNDAVQLLNPQTGAVISTYNFGDGALDMAVLEPIYDSNVWADKVVTFTSGTNAGFGSNFFPNNVLGPPDQDPNLTKYSASNKPQEILSLGNGGEIILEFTDNYIFNGDGVDFTVFENVFLIYGTNEPFIEAGIVSVSADGINFVTFPYDTSTWAGFAGVTPTLDNRNYSNPDVSGGDSFDLSDVGLDYARFVKITDIGDLKKEGAWNADFDLDAVIAVNSKSGQPTDVTPNIVSTLPTDFQLKQNYPNPFNPETNIRFFIHEKSHVTISIYNYLGQEINQLINEIKEIGEYSVMWDGKHSNGKQVCSGIYFYKMISNNKSQIRKMTLLR